MMDWWKKPRVVTVCVDTPGWFDTYAARLRDCAIAGGDDVLLVRRAADVRPGAIAFYLSCMKLTPPQVLARNKLNVVVHASALPQGRGFSPVVWQILEGRNEIPITMIEAAAEADSGNVLMTGKMVLEGHELNCEIRAKLGEAILTMCMRLLGAAVPPIGVPQQGETSWYGRRSPADSRLDPAKSLQEQFELLRVSDNDRYPAFFDYRGQRYFLRIAKGGPSSGEDRQSAETAQTG